ncbi:MAG: hypothetical protein HC898_04615 [Phycisphaerales bacterium]|nr:hypothetical protein [Phycisphaerales bacterium]NJO68329.1 hypothetical protein [Bacteroidota bacterium]
MTQNNDWDEHAHFSPDGQWIVWASSRGIAQKKSGVDARLDYWIMKVDGSEPKRLTFFNEPQHSMFVRGGAITSDLSWDREGKSFVGFVQVLSRRAVSPAYRFLLD